MAAALLSLAGFFVAVYLYLYKIGKIGTLACGTGACETVQLSPQSRFLGLEVALYGVGGYGTLLLLSLASLQTPPGERGRPGLFLVVLSAIGVLFTGYLTYLELFVIRAICRWCVVSAVIITLICIAAVLDWRSPARGDHRRPGDPLAR